MAASFGAGALLRVAGLPMRLWVEAGCPDLFGQLGELDELDREYRDFGVRLAERIGADLVPDGGLTGPERRLALRLRRQLHSGENVGELACRELAGVANRVLAPARDLADDLVRAADRSAARTAGERRAADAVDREQARLASAPWELIRSSPVAERALRGGNPATFRDIEQRVQRGEPWTGKRLRQRSDYLWRMIARGATKATPRQWLGHVALLPVTTDHLATFPPHGVEAAPATHAIENIHGRRRALADTGLADADPGVRLTIAPLHWRDGAHLQFWVVDPADPIHLRDLRLRDTPLLHAVRTELRSGPRSLGQIEKTLVPTGDPARRAVLRTVLGHLTGLGVLQLSMPPGERLDGWYALRHTRRAMATVRDGDDEYLDVYRRVTAPLSRSAVEYLQTQVRQAMRVLSLVSDAARQVDADDFPEVTERPQPVLKLVAQRLRATRRVDNPPRERPGWPAPAAGSAYGRLLAWLADHDDDPDGIDLTPALLDRLGVPDQDIDWPLDCMLRVPQSGSGPVAVLSHLSPAGGLDARFATALGQLHGDVPQVTAYREFLHRLADASGVEFVEVMVPPMSDRAANAVRRPLYTRAWTGDADLDTYCEPGDGPPPRHVPLSAITVRRRGDRLIAEADGRQIWPVYHATRSPVPPWDHLCRLLLATARPPLPSGWIGGSALGTFAGRKHRPRITVGGALVLACALWHIPSADLWDPTGTPLAKARALDRLRRRLGLPRWVFVASRVGGKPLPVDLESLRAIATLERVAAAGPVDGVVVEEMLPAPDRLAVSDHAHLPGDRLASELLLRLPCDESPATMAARIARTLADDNRREGGDSNADQRPAVRAGAQ